jgi:hypothetical protein
MANRRPSLTRTVQCGCPFLITAPHAGAGQLTVEVLDPDDHALGRAGRASPWRRERALAGRSQTGEADGDRRAGLAAPALPLFLRRPSGRGRGQRRHRGHGIHLADPAHAGGPHPGPAILPERRAGRGAGDRHGFEERAHFGAQFGAHRIDARGPESACAFHGPAECARNRGGAVPVSGRPGGQLSSALRGGDAHRRGGVHPAGAPGG